jgi:hypothetical protein
MKRACLSTTLYFAALAAGYYLIVRLFTQLPSGFDLLLAGLWADKLFGFAFVLVGFIFLHAILILVIVRS